MLLKNFIHIIMHLYQSDFICFSKNIIVFSKYIHLRKRQLHTLYMSNMGHSCIIFSLFYIIGVKGLSFRSLHQGLLLEITGTLSCFSVFYIKACDSHTQCSIVLWLQYNNFTVLKVAL